jgi:hypothetical protein
MYGELKFNYAAVSMFSQDLVSVYTALLERLWYVVGFFFSDSRLICPKNLALTVN